MHGAAMLQTPTSSAPTSEAVLPTVVDRREVASRRRRATRAVARLSIAAALALLGFEVAAQAQSSGHLSAAEATLSRWGDRMGAAAQDLLQERSRGTER
jgi:hypothetical protein